MAHPRVGLGVFVFKSRTSNELAWGLRKNSLGHGTWSLPGGHLEFGETFEQCAIREIAEETGLEIEDVRFLTATESMMKWQDREWHYVTIFMTAFAKGSTELKLMEPDKSDDWCWKSMKAGMKLDADTESDWTFFDPIKNFIKNRSTTCEQLDDPETLYREVLE